MVMAIVTAGGERLTVFVLVTAFLRLRLHHLPHRSQIGLARVDVFAGTTLGGGEELVVVKLALLALGL